MLNVSQTVPEDWLRQFVDGQYESILFVELQMIKDEIELTADEQISFGDFIKVSVAYAIGHVVIQEKVWVLGSFAIDHEMIFK